MSLIKCPECGKEISSSVKTCPNCGYRMKDNKKVDFEIFGKKAGKFNPQLLWIIPALFVVFVLVYATEGEILDKILQFCFIYWWLIVIILLLLIVLTLRKNKYTYGGIVMYCEKCGNKIEHHSKYCEKCGAEVRYESEESTLDKAARWIGVVMIAVMLLALFIGLDDKYHWIKKSDSESTTVSNEIETRRSTLSSENLINDDDDEIEIRTSLPTNRSAYTYDITYEMLARNPDDYVDARVKFTGTISQIVPVEDYEYSGFRMSVDNDADENLLVIYEKDVIDFSLLENDNVTIYAVYLQQYSYESTLGGIITVPLVCAAIIDLNENSLVSDCSLTLPTLPVDVSRKAWDGSTKTTVKVEDIKYEFEKSYDGTYYLTLTLTGVKTYENENLDISFGSCTYKLYDEDEYIVASGSIYFRDINVDEKFKNVTETIYNLPAGNYRLELLDDN